MAAVCSTSLHSLPTAAVISSSGSGCRFSQQRGAAPQRVVASRLLRLQTTAVGAWDVPAAVLVRALATPTSGGCPARHRCRLPPPPLPPPPHHTLAHFSRSNQPAPVPLPAASAPAGRATTATPPPAITLTDAALAHLHKLRAESVSSGGGGDAGKPLLLRMGVKSGGCSGMSYVMDFESEDNVRPDDAVMEYEGGFKLVGLSGWVDGRDGWAAALQRCLCGLRRVVERRLYKS